MATTINTINVGGVDKEIEDTFARSNSSYAINTADSAVEAIEALTTRVDQIIAPSGQAPNPAEVTDARIGYDGVTYSSLGNAIRNQFEDLEEALKNDGTLDIFPLLNTVTSATTFNGITATPKNNGSFTLNGTATAAWNLVFFNVNIENLHIKKGDDLIFSIIGEKADAVALELFYQPSGGSLTYVTGLHAKSNYAYTVPSNCSKLYLRVNVSNGVTVSNVNIRVNVYKKSAVTPQDQLFWLDAGTDMNTIKKSGVYGLASNRNYVNPLLPNAESGILVVNQGGGYCFQFAWSSRAYELYKRAYFNGTWTEVTNLNMLDGRTVNGKESIANNVDFNDVIDAGVYAINDSTTNPNRPFSGAGVLVVFRTQSHIIIQMAIPWSADSVLLRRHYALQETWTNWNGLSGGGGSINEYTFNEYQNTYSITATPSITTDVNNWLQPTGNQNDVSGAIMTLLQTGCCQLAPGDFYVDPNKIEMPEGSTLRGCGNSSKIILKGSSDGFAIKMGSRTQISDLTINGGGTRQATVGGRHAILWQGNYTQSRDDYTQPRFGFIDNVRISGFTGGGITCYDTGYATFNNLHATNVYIESCSAGINISYWSEYHQFTNVHTQNCTFGCINNGGNNVFTNCDFSGSTDTAFLIDNSSEQSPNSAHGSCVACVFNHTGSNQGTGIHIIGTHNGFVFDGCQIFFSKIILENNYGTSFTNCNFGQSNCNIVITGGGLTLFANNLHQGAPTISITGNSNVHFSNCYVRDTGAIVSA